MIKYWSFLLIACVFTACNTTSCRESNGNLQSTKKLTAEQDPMSKVSVADKIKVYKPDGSLQCDMGKPISIDDMKKELKNLRVYSEVKLHDGKMRVQLCGTPTGQCNVFEIHRDDLQEAVKLGYSEWQK
jgi:hypothetical protein